MTTQGRYAIIPTHNRRTDLAACVTSLAGQVDTLVVIDNASQPPVATYNLDPSPARLVVLVDGEQPPNLARLWNVGLDHVADLAATDRHQVWDVGVFNDDAVVPGGWWDAVAAALRSGPAVAACSDPYGTLAALRLQSSPDRDLMTRMCPWAFITRGEVGLRADEAMRWWWFDTDWDWRARQAGGVAIIPGHRTVNSHANASTVGPLAEQAGRDRETFRIKWGDVPW